VTLHELFKRADEVAPLVLSESYCKMTGAYDNSGVILDSGKDVTGVVFSLDFSIGAVNTAVEKGYTAIVTHHPAIFGGVQKIDAANSGLGEKLALCIKNGISVISMHLNADCAEGGIDDSLMKGLGGTDAKIMERLSVGGYGRVYPVEKKSFAAFCKGAEETFKTKRLLSYGDGAREISKVASFCGAGCDDKAIAFAKANHADVLVSADMKHHQITALLEAGICVVELTHYASENYGFMQMAQRMAKGLSVPVAFYTDENLL
jgi:dinuclear metal center YbgI/SA1388 family protein